MGSLHWYKGWNREGSGSGPNRRWSDGGAGLAYPVMILGDFVLNHSLLTALALLLTAFCFRLVDIFVLRLDERWGGILVSKLAAVALLFGFLLVTGAGLDAVGFQGRSLVVSIVLAVGLTLVALAPGFGMEFLAARRGLADPVLQLVAIDPKTGAAGGTGCAVLLLGGNIVNSFAEEGLFRGVALPLFMRELSPLLVLGCSALFFGLWHLPWA